MLAFLSSYDIMVPSNEGGNKMSGPMTHKEFYDMADEIWIEAQGDEMNIIELAKECGIVIDSNGWLTNDSGTYELESFATAIIENYKASLRPITVKCPGFELQLYALPLGEKK